MTVSRPAVFLFGWLGCRPHQLRQIANFYSDLDVDVEPFIEDPLSHFGIRLQHRSHEALYKKAVDRPILVHLFSLNGETALLSSFTQSGILKPGINLRGLITDSAPGHPVEAMGIRACAQALAPNSPTIAAIARALFPAVFPVVKAAYPGVRDRFVPVDAVFRRPFACPTLVLGSKKDGIVPHADMAEYASAAERAGATVNTRFWDGSGHVRLFKDYAEEYGALVRAFAQAHLIGSRKPGSAWK
jgi:pimeloyl-ACP methyl ester carboxylesterase